MGGVLSQFSKQQVSNRREGSPPPSRFIDPRSPSEGIQRTPIVIATTHTKPYLETNMDDLTPAPLRVKLLRKCYDPRSPTAEVDRTPISVYDMPEQSSNFASPVSVYSNYQSEPGSYVFSPNDPSVNVSDFENDHFAREMDSIVAKLDSSPSDIVSPPSENKLQLRPSPRVLSEEEKARTKKMCEELILEIVESFKECQIVPGLEQLVQDETPKQRLSFSDKQSLPGLKSKKKRKPLANITSAGNTPTKYQTPTDKAIKVNLSGENKVTPKLHLRKSQKRIMVDQNGENSPITPKFQSKEKVLRCNEPNNCTPNKSQWDQDTTVVI